MVVLKDPIQFDWDEGNKGKNYAKHAVSDQECEEVFFDQNKKIFQDTLHSGDEARYILLGRTKEKRELFVVFTVRLKKVRIISARDLNKREKTLYE